MYILPEIFRIKVKPNEIIMKMDPDRNSKFNKLLILASFVQLMYFSFEP